MHEFSIMQSLFDILLKKAAEFNAKRIISIHIRVGCLAGVEPDLLQSAFNMRSENTIAENAQFSIHITPFSAVCHKCGPYTLDTRQILLKCPNCGSTKVQIDPQDDLFIENMEVEVADSHL